MNIYDFKTAGYFPFHIMLIGGIMAPTGISMLAGGLYTGGLVVLVIGMLILTTHYRCRVDFDKKEYQDYIWVLGIRNGKRISFDSIQYIFIKQGQQSQTMGLRAANTTIHKFVYDSYLKFSEADKIHLITKDHHEDLVRKLRPIAEKLKTQIIDYSDGEPRII